MCIQAAGAVIFRPDRETPRFLLVQNARHGTWGFPKGHLEPGEALEEGAARECREETGLEIGPFEPDFCKTTEHRYRPKDGKEWARKETAYFLLPSKQGEVRISEEHDRHLWESRLAARKRLQYDNLREVLDCAYGTVAAKLDIPRRDVPAARRLLDEFAPSGEMWRAHCLEVARVARCMATALLDRQPSLPLDPETIEAAATVHDIGRYRDHGIEHPRFGMELLIERGLEHLAKPCISHWLKGRSRVALKGDPYFTPERLDRLFQLFDLDNITLAEKIISTADSLVQHDRLVRLEDRYRDARERYGDSRWMGDNETITAGFIKEIEDVLGGSLYALLDL